MANVNHSALTDPYLHEPKGAASAATNEVYVADGASSGSFARLLNHGIEDYNHAGATVAMTAASTWYDLINDGAGTFTNTAYKLPASTGVWDTSSNSFDWLAGGLSLGDTVEIRVDLTFTTSGTNNRVSVSIDLGHGAAGEYKLVFVDSNLKATGTHKVVSTINVYMGDLNTLNNPAKLAVQSDSTGDTVEIAGWYVKSCLRKPISV